MHYVKELFVKGRFHAYIGFGLLIEIQRNYLLPNSALYRRVRQTTVQQLKFIEPDIDRKGLILQEVSTEDLEKLKKVTKKKVVEIQNLCRSADSTWQYTCAILGLGSINYFFQPAVCAIATSSYILMLTLDYGKSISVIRFGVQPLWQSKMKDVGYLMSTTIGLLTIGVLGKVGVQKLKQRASRAIALRQPPSSK